MIDYAFRVALEENCHADLLAETALIGRNPGDFEYFGTCILLANHHIEWKNGTEGIRWLGRLDEDNLDEVFQTTVTGYGNWRWTNSANRNVRRSRLITSNLCQVFSNRSGARNRPPSLLAVAANGIFGCPLN